MTCTASRHGTYYAYCKLRCRCETAKQAKSRYEKRRRCGVAVPAYVDPTGTVRRLHALAAIGWPLRYLMREIGWGPNSFPGHLLNPNRFVHRSTAERVAEIYDRLCMTPGPSTHTRNRAKAKGWPPPLAWDDDAIDDADAQPELGDLAPPQQARREDTDWLRSQGLPDWEIAARLGVTVEALTRMDLRDRQEAS